MYGEGSHGGGVADEAPRELPLPEAEERRERSCA